MGPIWWATLFCVGAINLVQSIPLATEDTLVVANMEQTTEVSGQPSEATTDESYPELKITEMDVKSDVSLRYAHTAIVTKVRNPAKRAQEATFRVLLPESAFISGFVMILGGKPYKAYVKEKEEAKQIFNQAVAQGIGAAHIATKARDSNHFTVSVNVEANSEAVFNLTYEELLTRRNFVYNHAINLHPGTIVPKLVVTVHVKENQKIKDLRVPELRTGNEVDATAEDDQNTNAVIKRSDDGKEVTVTFTPDLEEQKRLMRVYAEKSKESKQHEYYRFRSEDPKDVEGVLGQFVVQYDVDRPKEGEILVNDGYFVHFYAPTSLPPLNKYVVFALDLSGSMSGRKILQLKEAMKIILSDLHKGDYFSIVGFSSGVVVYDVASGSEFGILERYGSSYVYNDNLALEAPKPSPVNPENIAKAKELVDKFAATGGTNILGALLMAVGLVQRGIKINENKTLDLEPIIIFLTDGEPTDGETDPKSIVTQLSEKNAGDKKATLTTLAFGDGADRSFLRKLSLRNDGFMRHIYEAADASLQLRDFYRGVSSPLLAHAKFTYPPEQVKEISLTNRKFKTIFDGSEVIIAGQLENSAVELTPEMDAFCGVVDDSSRKRYKIHPKVPVAQNRTSYFPLERLWTYLTIKQLLDKKDAMEDAPKSDKDESPEKKALSLALKYEFVTPLTSLVVVKPNETNAVNAESVDSSNSMPIPANPLAFRPALAAHAAFHSSSGYAFAALPGPMQISNSFLQPQADYEEEDFEESLASYDQTTQMDVPTTSIPQSDKYHLGAFQWALPLLDNAKGVLSFVSNNTDVNLNLVESNPPPVDNSNTCPHATDGSAGVCVYLTHCHAAQNITAEIYTKTYCIVNNGLAGVCCPKSVSEPTPIL